MAKRKNSKTGTKMATIKAKGRAGVILAINTVMAVAVGTVVLQAAKATMTLLSSATQTMDGAMALAVTGLVGYVALKQANK
jgi:hypothetical protein